MAHKVLTDKELANLFDSLFQDATTATHYLELICDINKAFNSYPNEFSVSNTFWYLSISALKEAMSVRLARLYIGQDGLTLHRLLKDIKNHVHLFESKAFKERLKDNSFVDSLSEIERRPSLDEIVSDISSVCETDDLVKKLMIWRHNVYMHTSYSVAKGNKNILKDNPISEEQIRHLIDKALLVLNKYSSLFRASTYSRGIIGHDDFLWTLDLLRLGIERREQNIQAEFKRLEESIAANKAEEKP